MTFFISTHSRHLYLFNLYKYGAQFSSLSVSSYFDDWSWLQSDDKLYYRIWDVCTLGRNSKKIVHEWTVRIFLNIQGHPWQSVYFGVKILGRKKVLRIIYPMDFSFPEKHISFAKTKFSRFWHFRKKVSWFQLFFDIFSKKNFCPVEFSNILKNS